MYRFFPIVLFVLELGAVCSVTAVTSVYAAQQEVERPEAINTERREVRLVVVPSNMVEEEQSSLQSEMTAIATEEEIKPKRANTSVPFYSQFADISSPSWQKVGCGIASLSMIIDYYSNEVVSVDGLLDRGIEAGAYISNAGWSHAGLIELSRRYGLDGESVSMAGLTMSDAFSKLEKALSEGPVMVSVHYTFEPTNPIPHLVVVSEVRDGEVIYNDPAEATGEGVISIEKFQNAWKKRYISIRPT